MECKLLLVDFVQDIVSHTHQFALLFDEKNISNFALFCSMLFFKKTFIVLFF